MTRASQGRVRRARSCIVVIWGVTAGLCPGTPAQDAPAARPDPRPAAAHAPQPGSGQAATDVALLFAGKATTRSEVESRLSAPVRAALDRWAAPAARLELGIALGERPEHVVLGHAPGRTLIDAARWMDQTFDLLDPLVPVTEGHARQATVAVLMDEASVSSKAWDALLEELQAQQLLIPEAVESLRGHAEGLTMRSVPLFVQPTFDVAGNSAAGDDEFRLGNEVVHKYAQCMLTGRTGQQPAPLLWGLGYVAELQLFDSAFHFNVAGFVAKGDHADWRGGARRLLEARRKDKQFSLAAMAADEQEAGRAGPPQMLTWAGLSYLSRRQPERLREMWTALAAAQAEADPDGVAPGFRGDPDRTGEILRGTLDAIDPKELSGFLKQGR